MEPTDRGQRATEPSRDDGDTIVVDGSNLRGLAHPMRLRLLERLRIEGQATASQLARELDTTSGDVSYHLRQLERYGFIAEVPELGNRRDRWWRARHRSSQFDPIAIDTGGRGAVDRELVDTLTDQIAQRSSERLLTATQTLSRWPKRWRASFAASDVHVVLTPQETRQLHARLLAVIAEYPTHRPDRPIPRGRRRVTVQLQTFLDDLPSDQHRK